MSQEIERKFLVNSNNYREESYTKMRITQGYLSSDPERTVRVRARGNKGYITVKGISNDTGTTRYEWEKEITLEDTLELLKICEPGIIDKTRFNVKVGNHTFEVDEFYGENTGLIVAEVELSSEDDFFEKPKWLGKEVTGDKRYYNSVLMKKPFKDWGKI